MAWYLVFWRRRSTKGYGVTLAARWANAQDSLLIRKGVWVRRRRDGSSPQCGSRQGSGPAPAECLPALAGVIQLP